MPRMFAASFVNTDNAAEKLHDSQRCQRAILTQDVDQMIAQNGQFQMPSLPGIPFPPSS